MGGAGVGWVGATGAHLTRIWRAQLSPPPREITAVPSRPGESLNLASPLRMVMSTPQPCLEWEGTRSHGQAQAPLSHPFSPSHLDPPLSAWVANSQ